MTEFGKFGFYATETVQRNIMGNCPMMPVKVMNKAIWGTYESTFYLSHFTKRYSEIEERYIQMKKIESNCSLSDSERLQTYSWFKPSHTGS